jgi:hypothetical protein
MFKIKVWNDEQMIFEGYSKRIPKAGQDFKAWTITKDNNGSVKEASFSPAQYRITYEDTQTK